MYSYTTHTLIIDNYTICEVMAYLQCNNVCADWSAGYQRLDRLLDILKG